MGRCPSTGSKREILPGPPQALHRNHRATGGGERKETGGGEMKPSVSICKVGRVTPCAPQLRLDSRYRKHGVAHPGKARSVISVCSCLILCLVLFSSAAFAHEVRPAYL